MASAAPPVSTSRIWDFVSFRSSRKLAIPSETLLRRSEFPHKFSSVQRADLDGLEADHGRVRLRILAARPAVDRDGAATGQRDLARQGDWHGVILFGSEDDGA